MAAEDRRAWHRAREQELQRCGQSLDLWRNAAVRLPRDQRVQYERTLDHLRGLLNRAVARLEHVRRASDDTWRNARMSADGAFSSLREAFDGFEATNSRPAVAA